MAAFLEVDATFTLEIQHRPQKTVAVAAESIPVIDLGSIFSNENAKSGDIPLDVVAKIGQACKEWGFFQVINHGVPTQVIQDMDASARKFFALPLEERMKVKRTDKNPVGYHDSLYKKNVRDWKEVFDFRVKKSYSDQPDDTNMVRYSNQWPEFPAEFREACEEYAKLAENLAFKIMELICLSLGLEAKRLNGLFDEHTSFIRVNHYPTCPSPDLALGSGSHKDACALTVLLQDSNVAGLEVKRKSDGEWIQITPTPDAFTINLGDLFQVWTNDEYESVEHRAVVNSTKERFTDALFFLPSRDATIQPIPELTNETKYKAFNLGEFTDTVLRNNAKNPTNEPFGIQNFKIGE